jgi:hypothetical protein
MESIAARGAGGVLESIAARGAGGVLESIAARGAGGVLEQTSYLPNYYFHNGKTNVPRHCVGRTLEYDNGESCVKNSAKPFATPLMPAAMDTEKRRGVMAVIRC